MPARPRTFDASTLTTEQLVAAKADRTVSVCIPARDEERTVGAVVRAVAEPHLGDGSSGLVDEIVVVDDGSTDDTGAVARGAGARIVRTPGGGRGKGGAMQAGLDASFGDVVVFLDADVENTTGAFVASLVGPLLLHDDVTLVKAFYRRPFNGAPDGGGRVTELLARPLIELLFPELVDIRQPLAGETAAHRWVLEKLTFAEGYGVEIGLLVDVSRLFGPGSIGQVDLGSRVHRNRPIEELQIHSRQVLRAALERHSQSTRD